MTGQPDAKLDPESRQNLYKALQSLNPEYEGYSLDDFMRAMTNLAAWQKEGRPKDSQQVSNEERVHAMINSTFEQAKANLDKIRNDVEQKRLEMLSERQKLDKEQAELQKDQERLERERGEHEARCKQIIDAENAKKDEEMARFREE